MSPNKDKSVPQLVEKYRKDKITTNLDRDLIRRLIRVEHPELFLDNASNLKKLDRHLKKSFKQKPKPDDLTVVLEKIPERGLSNKEIIEIVDSYKKENVKGVQRTKVYSALGLRETLDRLAER